MKNIAPGKDEIRITMIQNLPEVAKDFLFLSLQLYMGTGNFPWTMVYYYTGPNPPKRQRTNRSRFISAHIINVYNM